MAGSVTTTRISLLEIGTDQNYDDEGTLFIPSGSSVELSGILTVASAATVDLSGTLQGSGTADLSSTSFSPPAVEGSQAATTLLGSGMLSVFSLSGLTAYLAYVDASGVTIYEWESENGRTI